MLHGWDDASDFGYGVNMPSHDVNSWLTVMTKIVVEEKAKGHTVDMFKLDRGPELDCDELKRRVQAELRVQVIIGPSGEHESVHRAEAHMDPCNRATEAMISRAKRNLGDNVRRFTALARNYAVYLMVRRPPKMGEPSRLQRHTGQVPDFGDKNGMVPYVFGSRCIRLKDETERTGWKGAGHRTADGVFVGIDHTSYLVYNPVTHRVTKEPFIWCLDEFELATDGTAAGALRHDVATQCDLSTAAPLTLLPSAIKAPKAAPPPIQHADAPVGTRLEVFWRGKGKPDQWYVGTVTKIHTTHGQRRTSARHRLRRRRRHVPAARSCQRLEVETHRRARGGRPAGTSAQGGVTDAAESARTAQGVTAAAAGAARARRAA
jgi:hypothetical protein